MTGISADQPSNGSSRLGGRTAIVTGASRGIGLAIAQRLVADGARVVVTGRKQPALDDAVAVLGGPRVALGVAGHADDADHQAHVVALAIETFGGADLLVNNAGINQVYGPLMGLDLAAARKIVEDAGSQITTPDKQPFIDAMKPVYEKYVNTPELKDLVARIQAMK